jgi:hypothetical protein
MDNTTAFPVVTAMRLINAWGKKQSGAEFAKHLDQFYKGI